MDEFLAEWWTRSCGDGGCVVRTEPHRGMTTNGGCQHLKLRPRDYAVLLRTAAQDLARLRAQVSAAKAWIERVVSTHAGELPPAPCADDPDCPCTHQECKQCGMYDHPYIGCQAAGEIRERCHSVLLAETQRLRELEKAVRAACAPIRADYQDELHHMLLHRRQGLSAALEAYDKTR